MSVFTIKRGDTSPLLRYALSPNTVDITGASIRFQMRARFGAMVIDADGVIETTTPPVVLYRWQPGDTDTAGLFDAEFKITYADGAIETFPNQGFIPVAVNEDI